MSDGIEAGLEQLWLKQAQNGDYTAFERLHDLLSPSVTRFVRRMIEDGQQVEDIVQDTFVALFVNIQRIEPLSNLRPYLFRIARNACYDVLRRYQRRDEVSIDVDSNADGTPRIGFELPDMHSPAPDDLAHWLLLKLEVQEAIDHLPEAQREVLLLYCEEELTYQEIAETLAISIGTVKSRLFHAKKNLRGMVKPEILLAIQDNQSRNSDELSAQAIQLITSHQVNEHGETYHGRNPNSETTSVESSVSRSA